MEQESAAAFREVHTILNRLDPETDCQHCGQPRTHLHAACYCAQCRRLLCKRCSGGGEEEITPVGRCGGCRANLASTDDILSTAEQRLRRLRLHEKAQEVITDATREGTVDNAWRGIRALEEYADEYRTIVLPTSVEQLVH